MKHHSSQSNPRRRSRAGAAPSPAGGQVASPRTGEADCLDIVADIFARLVACNVSIDGAVLARLETDVRRDWGGERPYVAKHGQDRAEFTARDERIRTEHRRGESVTLLSRRHGLSARRIRQILGR